MHDPQMLCRFECRRVKKRDDLAQVTIVIICPAPNPAYC